MTFRKGRSGNPGGRPKGFKSFKQTATSHMDSRGIVTLIAMADGDGEDRRFALKLLAEYAYGKPQQHMDVTSGGQPLVKAYVGVDVDKACP